MTYDILHNSIVSIEVADHFFQRLNGLMFRKSLASGHGLLLINCPAVHTCFMRFPIDVVYLTSEFVVLDIQTALKPWRVGKSVAGARHVIELSAGDAQSLTIGYKLLHKNTDTSIS